LLTIGTKNVGIFYLRKPENYLLLWAFIMNKIRRNIPNAITCGNLLCGCLAIVQAFEGDLVWAAYLVGIAAILDFFDGFTARLLHVTSPIGKDLDSLADMVTFGVVPGVVMFQLLKVSTLLIVNQPIWLYMPYVAFLIPVFSGIRLAKFNNDARQAESFIGVNTPANSMLICSLPLIIGTGEQSQSSLATFILNPYLLITITVIMSFLLISELPIFSFKFKSFGWAGNQIRYVFLIMALILLVTLQFVGIPLVIVLYILMSVINNFLTKNKASQTK
jgi:CDP-diacylglycerol--serine O-phosphatidyltransferase